MFLIINISTISPAARVNDFFFIQDAYADPATCFLNVKNKMIWSFAGPVCFIIGVSFENKTNHIFAYKKS